MTWDTFFMCLPVIAHLLQRVWVLCLFFIGLSESSWCILDAGSISDIRVERLFSCFVFLATAFWGMQALHSDLVQCPSFLSWRVPSLLSLWPKSQRYFFTFPSTSVIVSVHTFKWIVRLDWAHLWRGHERWGLFCLSGSSDFTDHLSKRLFYPNWIISAPWLCGCISGSPALFLCSVCRFLHQTMPTWLLTLHRKPEIR